MRKDLIKLFKSFGYKYDLYTIFSDFVELAALSISNTVDKPQYEKREAKYLQVIGKYTRKEAQVFPEMLAILTTLLEKEPTDILGQVYMELEISNDDAGQFFTPMSVSKLMAQMMISDYETIIKDKGFVTVNEPTVGGGVTIIALAEALKGNGYNYQKQMKVVAQDIDIKSVHMCYVQLSLLGIDAEVWRGNTLTYEFDSFWYTPMNIINRIEERRKKKEVNLINGMKKAIDLVSEKPKEPMQLSLF